MYKHDFSLGISWSGKIIMTMYLAVHVHEQTADFKGKSLDQILWKNYYGYVGTS